MYYKPNKKDIYNYYKLLYTSINIPRLKEKKLLAYKYTNQYSLLISTLLVGITINNHSAS